MDDLETQQDEQEQQDEDQKDLPKIQHKKRTVEQ